jgi:hypothetical protein
MIMKTETAHKRPPTLVVARTTALLKYIAKSAILLKVLTMEKYNR